MTDATPDKVSATLATTEVSGPHAAIRCIFCGGPRAAELDSSALCDPAQGGCGKESGYALHIAWRAVVDAEPMATLIADAMRSGHLQLEAAQVGELPEDLRSNLADPETAGVALDALEQVLRARGVHRVQVLDPQRPRGAMLLDLVHATLGRYVAFPRPEARDAVTLWVAATHAQVAWDHAGRLVVKSPVKRCGKSRLLEIIAGTAHNALPTANVSPAALVRSITHQDPPTLLVDEADTVWSRGRGRETERSEDLRGILNAGHSRNWPYIRWNAAAREREVCPTFAMVALGAIGSLPDTIEDRAVVVTMRRRAPNEHVEPLRTRDTPALHAIRDDLHAWIQEHRDVLRDSEPSLPVTDRAADVWAPLVAIANLAGADWPERARRACTVLAGGGDPEDASLSERVLADLAALWPRGVDGDPQPYVATADLLALLTSIEEAPWADVRGRPLSPRGLADFLRPYGVKPRSVRRGSDTAKGYAHKDLVDPWSRYLQAPLPAQAAQRHTGESSSGSGCDGTVPDAPSTSGTPAPTGGEGAVCDGVPAVPEGVPAAILRALAASREPLNWGQVVETTGLPVAALRDPWARLIEEGRVTRLGDGRYVRGSA